MINLLEPYQRPPVWTAEHVIHRLILAFESVMRMKIKTGPAGYGSGWPSYVHEWADLLAQEEPVPGETRSEAEQRRIGERLPVVLPPSSLDISLMEEAFVWPLRYLGGDNAEDIAIMRWAMRRAKGHDANKPTISMVLLEASEIARGLRNDRVMVR